MGHARLEGPGHADLIDAQADFSGHHIVDTHVLQRLHDVQIGLARSDNTQPRLRAIHYQTVDAVDTGELPRRIDLELVEPQLLFQRLVRPARMHAIGGHLEVFGHDDVDTVGIDVRRNG